MIEKYYCRESGKTKKLPVRALESVESGLVVRGDFPVRDIHKFFRNHLPADRRDPVHEHLAVQMVEFMLDHAAGELVEFFRDFLEITVQIFHADPLGPPDLGIDARDTQAAFRSKRIVVEEQIAWEN